MDFSPADLSIQLDSALSALELEKQSSNSKPVSSGRWTKSEHQRFVEGLKLFGKDWKKVEDYVGTRNGAQVRSHAQKFFKRLHREFTVDSKTQNIPANSHANKENQPMEKEKSSPGAISELTLNAMNQLEFRPYSKGEGLGVQNTNSKQNEQMKVKLQTEGIRYSVEDICQKEANNNKFLEMNKSRDEQNATETLKALLLQKIAASQNEILEIHSILKRVKQNYFKNDENFLRNNTCDLTSQNSMKFVEEDSSKKKRLKEMFVKNSAFRVSMEKTDAETLRSKLSLLKNSLGNEQSMTFKKVKML